MGRCHDSRELVIVAKNRIDYLSKTMGQEIEVLYTASGAQSMPSFLNPAASLTLDRLAAFRR